MELRDSRRLTGANFLWSRPGALLEVTLAEDELDLEKPLIEAWSLEARRLFESLGWQAQSLCVRELGIPLEARSPDCARCIALALSAPLDGLYTATSVAEAALDGALARLNGKPLAPGDEKFLATEARLRKELAEEVNPALLALRQAAHARDVCFLSDDDKVSVGMGAGSLTFAAREAPDPARVAWEQVHDLPMVVVTGTNGKSTTVRLLAAVANAAGLVPGISSTDWVRVGDEILDVGDWSGPGGARLVLREKRVELALLETARGGLMRRGMALESCGLAVILNISADHLADWGTPTLEDLADAKFIVTRVASCVVLNADDEQIVKAAARHLNDKQEIIWFSLDAESELVRGHLAGGGRAVLAETGKIVLRGPWHLAGDRSTQTFALCTLADIPLTLGGAALYNVANALAAVAAAADMGIEAAAISRGLRDFKSDPKDNPGRLNEFLIGGVRVLVDFAHNHSGLAALCELTSSLPAQRRLILLGQAGDRDEESIREMVRIAWQAGPAMLLLKELDLHLRGRELGEVPAIMEDELRQLGAPADRWSYASSELQAVQEALEWAQPGDLLLLLIHDSRDEVLAKLGAAAAETVKGSSD